MSNPNQQAPNNNTNQNQQSQPQSNPPNYPNNQQGNQNPWGQFMPPYGYPYPFPNQQPPNNGGNSNNQQQAPPPYPYPPYPYPPYGFPFPNQGGQPQNQGNSNQNNSNQQNQQPNPYPPYGFPYPYPYPPPPPPQQNQGDSNQPPFPYPPYGYPPYPYPYPPPQQQQQQSQPQQQQQQQQNQPQPQQQQQHIAFDWERRGLPSFNTPLNNNNDNNNNSNNNNNNNNDNQQSQANSALFDWEKGNTEPQKKIVIDWNYKSEYDVPDVPPDVQRDTSVSATCTSKAFDPSVLPVLDDSFYKLFPSEIASQAKANSQKRNFHARNKSNVKETFRVKFQFSEKEIEDLNVSATFHIKEHTCRLYEFLNEVVFNEGTKYIIKTTVPAKAIGNNHNQQLRDVKITGNTILFVKISQFTGLKDDVNQQYSLQKAAINEKIQQLEQEKKSKEAEEQKKPE